MQVRRSPSYPPSVILARAGLSRPDLVRLLGSLDVDRVPLRPAPPSLRRFWIGEVGAMTLPWGIYVRPELLAGEPERLARLVLHELVHVRQWREMGVVRFLRRYLAEYLVGRRRGLGHREAYRGISLEEEARRMSRLR